VHTPATAASAHWASIAIVVRIIATALAVFIIG
jgi:hypothetical protein